MRGRAGTHWSKSWWQDWFSWPASSRSAPQSGRESGSPPAAAPRRRRRSGLMSRIEMLRAVAGRSSADCCRPGRMVGSGPGEAGAVDGHGHRAGSEVAVQVTIPNPRAPVTDSVAGPLPMPLTRRGTALAEAVVAAVLTRRAGACLGSGCPGPPAALRGSAGRALALRSVPPRGGPAAPVGAAGSDTGSAGELARPGPNLPDVPSRPRDRDRVRRGRRAGAGGGLQLVPAPPASRRPRFAGSPCPAWGYRGGRCLIRAWSGGIVSRWCRVDVVTLHLREPSTPPRPPIRHPSCSRRPWKSGRTRAPANGGSGCGRSVPAKSSSRPIGPIDLGRLSYYGIRLGGCLDHGARPGRAPRLPDQERRGDSLELHLDYSRGVWR